MNDPLSTPAEADPADSAPSAGAKRLWQRTGFRLGCALLVLLVVLVLAGVAAEWESQPEVVEGRSEHALSLTQRVDLDAWERTGAVAWNFAGMHDHLWDRRRGYARVVKGPRRVLLRISDQSGRAWEGEQELDGAARDEALAWAWAQWCNDSFWLNPFEKLDDEGVTVADAAKGRAVLVSFSSGGVTPGDAYLWELNAEGLPTNMKMWVSIVPIPGLDVTWEGWIQLDTGAWISTQHRIAGVIPLKLSQVRGAATLKALVPGEDPFSSLEAE